MTKKNIVLGVMAWLFLIGAFGGILWIVKKESSGRFSPTTTEQEPTLKKSETAAAPELERYETKADAKKSLEVMEQSISTLDEDIE